MPGSPPSDLRVVAVVVTHDRRVMLEECLDRLAAQTRRPDAVLVVDNASQDGTSELLAARDDVEVLRLPENVGGAGGFRAGLEAAMAGGATWAWLMDDDSFCDPDALAELLAAEAAMGVAAPSVLASRVEWTDGSPHPMNQPWPELGATREATLAAARAGVMPLRAASFVSALVHRRAVERHGLPHAEYFIYNDDLEYTARVLRHEVGFWVPASRVVHSTGIPRTPADAGGGRFYYDVRNRIFMLRGSAWRPRERLLLLRHLQHNVRGFLRRAGWDRAAVATVARGVRDGLRGPARGGGARG